MRSIYIVHILACSSSTDPCVRPSEHARCACSSMSWSIQERKRRRRRFEEGFYGPRTATAAIRKRSGGHGGFKYVKSCVVSLFVRADVLCLGITVSCDAQADVCSCPRDSHLGRTLRRTQQPRCRARPV